MGELRWLFLYREREGGEERKGKGEEGYGKEAREGRRGGEQKGGRKREEEGEEGKKRRKKRGRGLRMSYMTTVHFNYITSC